MDRIAFNYAEFLEGLVKGNGIATMNIQGKEYFVLTKEAFKELEKKSKRRGK